MDRKLEDIVLEKANEFRTDRLVMSFGEIMNMYIAEEIIINPNFQRAFRWDKEKQTDLIESILLGIPIPPIFVAENAEGRWELVDGLQRVSTVLSFFGLLKNVPRNKNNLMLQKGKIVKELEDLTIDNIPFRLKILLKRATIGVEVLNRNSNETMKYELFKRLNTTSEPLSDQEIRNAVFAGKLNDFLHKLASSTVFIELMKPTKKQEEKMYLEELVLRYFAFKNSLKMPNGVRHHLDRFMRAINGENIPFDYDIEEAEFFKIINFINRNFGRDIFKAKNGHITKNLYDSLTYVLRERFDIYKDNPSLFKEKVKILKEDIIYKKITDRKRESRTADRIKRALEIF